MTRNTRSKHETRQAMDKQQMTDHDLLIRIDERTEGMENDLKEGKARFAKHDKRIRRIEMWFVPVLAALSIASHKLMNWLHL